MSKPLIVLRMGPFATSILISEPLTVSYINYQCGTHWQDLRRAKPAPVRIQPAIRAAESFLFTEKAPG